MANIEFNENPVDRGFAPGSYVGNDDIPSLARPLVNMGIVKTGKQAQGVLVGVILLLVLVSVIVMMRSGRPSVDPDSVPKVAGPNDVKNR